MGIAFDKALGVHPDALRVRAQRTEVLASNIANADTPGYQARDIDFASALGAAGGDGADADGLMYRVPFHPSRDGNTVELSVEQAEFAQNVSDFQTSLTFLNMKMRGLAKAIAGQ